MKAKPKMPADWYATSTWPSLKIGRAGLPEIVDVTEYRDIIGVGIQKAIEGELRLCHGPGPQGIPGIAGAD